MSILDELNTALAPLSAGVEALEVAVAAVGLGEQALRTGDAFAALAEFERASAALAEPSPRIAKGADASRAAIAVVQELTDRVHALMAEARAAEGSGNWPAVMELCSQVLAIEPQRPDVGTLVSRAEAALEAMKQARVRRVQMLVTQAGRAVQESKFDEADRILNEAHALEIDESAVMAVRSRLDAARMAAAAADARARHAAQALAEARRMFDAGERQAAMRCWNCSPAKIPVRSALRMRFVR